MLNVLSNQVKVKDKEIINTPWDKYFRKFKITKYFDNSDIDIVRDVEKTTLINNDTIYGKFSDMPIGIGNMSEGCKTLLCINHAIKNGTVTNYVFNITSCGGNAVAYLITKMASDKDIYVIMEHSDFGHFNDSCVSIDGYIEKDSISASNRLVSIRESW